MTNATTIKRAGRDYLVTWVHPDGSVELTEFVLREDSTVRISPAELRSLGVTA